MAGMASVLGLIGEQGAGVCPLCGAEGSSCATTILAAGPLIDMTEPEVERKYRVREAIWEGGRQVYHKGALIALQEAVLRGLPDAAQIAAGKKPTHALEDRAEHPGENR